MAGALPVTIVSAVHPSSPFLCVLGRSLLLEAAADPRRRVVLTAADRVLAVAAFEPLYGPQAEFAVSCLPGADAGPVESVLDLLAAAAERHGVRTLRATIGVDQRALAATIRGGRVRGDVLHVDVAQRLSVATTDPVAGDTPMISGPGAVTLCP